MTPEVHKKIGIQACLPVLHAALPQEDLGYFLLGNWFTDMSQGIAPVDYAATMSDARNEGVAAAKKSSWFLRYIVPDFITHSQANTFVRKLLGDPPPKNSAMTRWFTDAAFVAGWIEFCYPDGPAKSLAHYNAGPISFEEYDRIFFGKKAGKTGEGRFTQYFPHEHFDRWPMDRTEKSDRKGYKYIEDNISNIAELLTLIDRDWVDAAKQPLAETRSKRHDLLAEFGYALHTAEDFWAHTNYVDFMMKKLGRLPSDEKGKRIFQRRLLRDVHPRSETFAEPGPTESETHVVGGFFDGIDTRFSLLQIYKGIREKLAYRAGAVQDLSNVRLMDWREYKTKDERKKYKESLAIKQQAMNMPQKVRDAELSLVKNDWSMMDEWDGKCVSWVLEKMLKEGEQYAKTTFRDGSRYAERIGSHTLIAKDDQTKQPWFEEAMGLAKRVDRFIVQTMVRSIKAKTGNRINGKSGEGKHHVLMLRWVDWESLLRYFMGHPDEAPSLAGENGASTWFQNALKDIEGEHGHELRFIDGKLVDERAELNTRRRLEKEHNSMIGIENTKYEAERSGDGAAIEDAHTLAKTGDEKTYQHDDMDYGSVRIKCLTGSIKVELSAAVWKAFKPIDSVVLNSGQIWSGDFKELSRVCDQDNRAVVTAMADDSRYEIMMVSYDR
jgi:hypothetical protein